MLQPVEFHATATFEQLICDNVRVDYDEIRGITVRAVLLAGFGHGLILSQKSFHFTFRTTMRADRSPLRYPLHNARETSSRWTLRDPGWFGKYLLVNFR